MMMTNRKQFFSLDGVAGEQLSSFDASPHAGFMEEMLRSKYLELASLADIKGCVVTDADSNSCIVKLELATISLALSGGLRNLLEWRLVLRAAKAMRNEAQSLIELVVGMVLWEA